MRLIAPPLSSLLSSLLLSLALIGPCLAANSADSADTAAPPAAAASALPQPVPLTRRIYQFQHRLIPGWVHKSSGAFYADLRAGNLDRLREAASEAISPEYAAGIKVTPYPALDGVLIEYPAPEAPPLCYFAFIHADPKAETGYAIYTYEKTMNFPGMQTQAVGVVGGWSRDGTHSNIGSRPYQDAEAFVRDLKLAKE